MKWLIIPGLLLASCNNVEKSVPKLLPQISDSDTVLPATIAGNFSDQTSIRFDSTTVDSFIHHFPLFSGYKDELKKFYSPRQYAYAWHSGSGLIEQSSILYNLIQTEKDNKIISDIPYVEQYTKMVEEVQGKPDPMQDLMLTAQYLHYAEKVVRGLSADEMKTIEWYVPRKKLDFTALLDTILTGKKIKAEQLIFRQYFKLKEKLKMYHDMENNGSWIVIRPDRKKYQLGDSSPVIVQIRKKLFLSGDIKADNQDPIFDSAMYFGIRSFQARYGLKEDGVAGSGVLNELAAPLSKRIQQIVVNMERCRWLPTETDSNYLVVNVPQFKLLVYENHELNWSCNVVVGKETNKTVIFKGDMKYVVMSPYWNVPTSIINKEIRPAMKRNKNYLASHNMEWNNGNIRQKPGPNNSLGLVKFLFPNSYNIYLHDTPSKSLFQEDRRAFSHGCIRVAEPRRLAEYLLRNNSSWPKDRIWNAMNSGKEQFVTLNPTVPVYIVYFTAFVDHHGKLNFRDDIYRRDDKLASMLFTSEKQEKKTKNLK